MQRIRPHFVLAIQLLLVMAISLLHDVRRHIPLFLLLFTLAAAAYLIASLLARRSAFSLRAILLWMVLLRTPMFATTPWLSDDVWRYMHDGHAQRAGANPYRFPPKDTATLAYRGPEFSSINHPELRTIYPPLAQLSFRFAAHDGRRLFIWRALLLAAEITIVLAGAVLLRRRGGDVRNLAVYAWHPLAIVEATGSAHLDPLGIAFLVVAFVLSAAGSKMRAGAAVAASVATKLIAAPLLLLMTKHPKLPVTAAALLCVLYAPFVLDGTNALGSLIVFAQQWESNGSFQLMLAPLVGPRIYRMFAAALLVAVLIAMQRRKTELTTASLFFFLALFLLAPVVHPWYLLWILALVPLRAPMLDTLGIAALCWTVTVAVAYVALHQQHAAGVWRIPAALLLLEYLPVYTFAIMYLMPRAKKTAAKMYLRTLTSVR